MRKAYAVDLMHKYGDIEKVQRDLNHASPMITMVYAMADVLAQTAASRKIEYKRKR
jgi:hypothetical protein